MRPPQPTFAPPPDPQGMVRWFVHLTFWATRMPRSDWPAPLAATIASALTTVARRLGVTDEDVTDPEQREKVGQALSECLWPGDAHYVIRATTRTVEERRSPRALFDDEPEFEDEEEDGEDTPSKPTRAAQDGSSAPQNVRREPGPATRAGQLLAEVRRHPYQTTGAMADAVGIPSVTASAALAKLRDAEFISSKRIPNRGRVRFHWFPSGMAPPEEVPPAPEPCSNVDAEPLRDSHQALTLAAVRRRPGEHARIYGEMTGLTPARAGSALGHLRRHNLVRREGEPRGYCWWPIERDPEEVAAQEQPDEIGHDPAPRLLDPTPKQGSFRAEVLDAVRATPGRRTGEIAEALGVSTSLASTLLSTLRSRGLVVGEMQPGRSKGGWQRWYAVEDPQPLQKPPRKPWCKTEGPSVTTRTLQLLTAASEPMLVAAIVRALGDVRVSHVYASLRRLERQGRARQLPRPERPKNAPGRWVATAGTGGPKTQ